MPWLMIFQLFQSKIGKVLFKFIKNKELRNWLKKGLFNENLYEKGLPEKGSLKKGLFKKGISKKGLFKQGFVSKALSKKGLLSGKKLIVRPRQPEE
jgi:hypothetical protein